MKKYKLVLLLPMLFILAACSTEEINTFKEQVENMETSEINEILQVNEEGLSNIDLKALSDEFNISNENEVLSSEEIEGIIFMIEEEKLAHDVYMFLYDKWGQNSFINIASSESTHIDAVKRLADDYGLDISFYDDEIGVFTDEKLQGLYDDLTAQGSTSLLEALKMGALIEEIDIVDLQNFMAQTDNEDILLVYENLEKGSRNHLRSFIGNISNQNGDYEPSHLTEEEYSQIVGSNIERGSSRGGGNGRRGR